MKLFPSRKAALVIVRIISYPWPLAKAKHQAGECWLQVILRVSPAEEAGRHSATGEEEALQQQQEVVEEVGPSRKNGPRKKNRNLNIHRR